MELINEGKLKELIESTVEEMKPRLEEDLTGRTVGMNEFRKDYCGGKSPEWVRAKIFDRYPEVDADNGGFVVNPRANENGRKTIIFVNRASKWIEAHQDEIDWNEKMEG